MTIITLLLLRLPIMIVAIIIVNSIRINTHVKTTNDSEKIVGNINDDDGIRKDKKKIFPISDFTKYQFVSHPMECFIL